VERGGVRVEATGQDEGSAALIDSAAVLARRALALDPGDMGAVNTLGSYEEAHGRPAAQRALVERAVRAHPSSAELRMLLAIVQYESGDTTPAWPGTREALRLAPRSTWALERAFMTALALRRHADAGELVARLRALDPAPGRGELRAARLAAAEADSAGVAAALRDVPGERRRSARTTGRSSAAHPIAAHADATGRRRRVARGTPATFQRGVGGHAVRSTPSSGTSCSARRRGARPAALARGLAARAGGSPRARRRSGADLAPAPAWFAAAGGPRDADRALALRAVQGADCGTRRRVRREADLHALREGGGALGRRGRDARPAPALPHDGERRPRRRAPHRAGVRAPRRRPAGAALAAELAAAEQRARTTPVQPAR
jgi:hypothetical protein